MSSANDFRKKYEVKLLENKTAEQEALDKAFEKYKEHETKKNEKFNTDKGIQEYFNFVVATILIEQNKYYEYHGINIPYRIKSRQSIKNKLDSGKREASISYNERQEMEIKLKPILDSFAMKIISRRRPPAFASTDPEIQALIEEKKKNQLFLEEMQKFKGRLIKDEYTKPENYEFKYECTKKEYYEKCRKVVEHLKQNIDPQSVNLLSYYDEKLQEIDTRLEFINATHIEGEKEEIVDKEDLTDKNLNFFNLLSEYENSVYNKSDLAILTKQIVSIFKDNPVFEKLNVSLSEDISPKRKRTENGFESNFIYLNTLFGPIECQLQTEDQYRAGNYGHAAHGKLKGKAIKPLPIPTKKEKIKEFIKKIKTICPKGYLARLDDNEKRRVMIQEYGDYQNYKNLISQISKGSTIERFINNYFAKLYAIRSKIFRNEDKSYGFIEYDIKEYIKSDRFKKLKAKYLNNNEQTKQEEHEEER